MTQVARQPGMVYERPEDAEPVAPVQPAASKYAAARSIVASKYADARLLARANSRQTLPPMQQAQPGMPSTTASQLTRPQSFDTLGQTIAESPAGVIGQGAYDLAQGAARLPKIVYDQAAGAVQGLANTELPGLDPFGIGDMGRAASGLPPRAKGPTFGDAMRKIGLRPDLASDASGLDPNVRPPESIAGQLGQGVASVIPAFAGAALTGGGTVPMTLMAAAQSYGGAFRSAWERALQMGANEEQANQIADAQAVSAGVTTALTQGWVGKALQGIRPQTLERAVQRAVNGGQAESLLRVAMKEGGQEGIEELNAILSQYVAEDDPTALQNAPGRLAMAVGAGALGGGLIAGVQAVGSQQGQRQAPQDYPAQRDTLASFFPQNAQQFAQPIPRGEQAGPEVSVEAVEQGWPSELGGQRSQSAVAARESFQPQPSDAPVSDQAGESARPLDTPESPLPSNRSSLTIAELRSLDLQRGGTGKGTKSAILRRLEAASLPASQGSGSQESTRRQPETDLSESQRSLLGRSAVGAGSEVAPPSPQVRGPSEEVGSLRAYSAESRPALGPKVAEPQTASPELRGELPDISARSSSYSSLPIDQLRSEAQRLGLDSRGTKAAVLKRLQTDQAARTPDTSSAPAPDRSASPVPQPPLAGPSPIPSTSASSQAPARSMAIDSVRPSTTAADPSPTSSQSAGSVREPSERVVAAAVLDRAGKIYSGPIHADAWDAYTQANTNNPAAELADSEGFVTNTGRYVSREEAARLEGLPSNKAMAENFGRFVDAPGGGSRFQWRHDPDLQPKAANAETKAPDVGRAGSPPDGVEAPAGVSEGKAEQFRKQLGDVLKSPEEGDAVFSLVEARAKAAGESVEQYVGNRVAGVERGGNPGPDALRQDPAKNLVVMHNMSAQNVLFSKNLEGLLAMPSVAIADVGSPLTGFGEISLVAPKELVDPKASKTNRVYDTDVYSARYPQAVFSLKSIPPEWSDIEAWAKDTYGDLRSETLKKEDYEVRSLQYGIRSHFDAHEIDRRGPEGIAADAGIMAYYASKKLGKTFKGTDNYDTKRKLRSLIEKNKDAFESWIRAEFEPYFTRRIFAGFTNSGNRRYKDYTIDNVMKEMRKSQKEDGGEGFFYGAGSVRAQVAKKYKSIAQIQKDRGRIVPQGSMESTKSQYNDRLIEIASDGMSAFGDAAKSSFGFTDRFWGFVIDAKKKGRAFAEKSYDVDYDAVPWEKVDGLLAELQALPTEYFEAKVDRAVGIGEFSGAVIPDDTKPEVIDALRSFGVSEIATYKRSNEKDRARAIADLANKQGLLFQGAKGAIEFARDGRAIIHAFESADVSTMVHEIGHLFRRDLAGPELATAEKWAGAKGGQWSRSAEERFARGFERYLRDGKSPIPALSSVFAKFKAWLSSIYKTITGSDIDVKIPADMRRVYDSLFVEKTSAAPTPTPKDMAALKAKYPGVTFKPVRGVYIPSTLKGAALAEWRNTASGVPFKDQIALLDARLGKAAKPEVGAAKPEEAAKPTAEGLIARSGDIRAKIAAEMEKRAGYAMWIDHQLITPDGKFEFVDGRLRRVQDLSMVGFRKNLMDVMDATDGEGKWWGANDSAKRMAEEYKAKQARLDEVESEGRRKESDRVKRESDIAAFARARADEAMASAKFVTKDVNFKTGTENVERSVKAPTLSGLVVHKSFGGKGYDVTHIASGKRINREPFSNQNTAKLFAARLSRVADFTKGEADITKQVTPEVYRDEISPMRFDPYAVTHSDRIAFEAKERGEAEPPKSRADKIVDEGDEPTPLSEPRDLEGRRKSSSVGRIQPSPLGGKSAKSLVDIRVDLAKALDVNIRTGKTRPGSGGFYQARSKDTVVRFSGDLDVMAHELGHNLDDTYGLVKDWAADRERSPFDSELIPHFSQYGSVTSGGPRAKLKYQRTEGVAEWFRALIVNPEAAKAAAPKFAAHYEAKVPEDIRAKIESFSADVRKWYGANPIDQAVANVRMRMKAPGLWQKLKDAAKGSGGGVFKQNFGQRLWTQLVDDLNPLWTAIAAAHDLRGLDISKLSPRRNTKILVRTWAGVDRKIMDILQHGPIHTDGERVEGMGGVDWLLEPIRMEGMTTAQVDAEADSVVSYAIASRVLDRTKKMEEAATELKKIAKEAEEIRATLEKFKAEAGGKAGIDGGSMVDRLEEIRRAMKYLRGKLMGYNGPVSRVDQYVASRMQRFAGIGAGIRSDVTVAREIVEQLQKDPARMRRVSEAANRMSKWFNWTIDYAEQSGRLSAAQAESIRTADDAYVSFSRVQDPDEQAMSDLFSSPAPGSGRRLASVREVSQKIKGSTKQIENPYVSLLSNTHRIIKESDRNKAMTNLVRDFTIRRNMHDKGREPINLSMFMREAKPGDKDTTRVFVDGEAKHYQFAPEIHGALRKWSEEAFTPSALKPVRFMASTLRTLITSLPPFMIRNMIRDPISRAVLSRTGSKPLAQFQYALKPAEFSKDLAELRRYGGGLFGNWKPSADYSHKYVADKLAELASDRGVIVTMPRRLMQGASEVFEASESIGRLAEFTQAKKYAVETLKYSESDASLYAAFQARDLLDYSRAGSIIRPLAQYIPFLNASIQGLARSAQGLAESPRRVGTKWAAYVLLPSVAAYLYNALMGDEEEYRQLPAWRRDFFMNFKVGPDLWVAIPKPFEMGVLASGVERAIDRTRGNKGALDGYVGSVAKGLVPIDETAFTLGFGPMIEQLANRDFFRDQYIVPPWEEKLDMSLRDGTKRASRVGQLIQDGIGLDARRVDHLSQALFGTAGTMVQMASDLGRDDREDEGRRFGMYSTGILRPGPAASATDVRAVLAEMQRRGLTSTAQYKSFVARVRAVDKAKTPTERDTLSKALRESAARLRAHYEKIPVKKKPAT